MIITESSLRKIIREEISRISLIEAETIRRRPGSPDGPTETRVNNEKTKSSRMEISSMADVRTTPDKARRLPANSPFVGGTEFHQHYNMGVGEEKIAFKVKAAGGDEYLRRILKNNKIGPGSLVVIPELYSLAKSPVAASEAFGVAEVIETVTLPNNSSSAGVPVVLLRFPDDQRPAGALESQPHIGLAFLQLLGWREAIDARKAFAEACKNSSSERNARLRADSDKGIKNKGIVSRSPAEIERMRRELGLKSR